jgi:hypothetical protein
MLYEKDKFTISDRKSLLGEMGIEIRSFYR